MPGPLLKPAAREPLVAFTAGFSLLCGSLAAFVERNDYPYLRAEVGLAVAAILVLSAVMAAVYRGQPQWVRSFLEGLLGALIVDLNSLSILPVGLTFIAIGALTWWRKMSLIGPMALIGSIILVTTVAGIGGNPPWMKTAVTAQDAAEAAPAKPAILHLILDEHLGLEGLPDDDPMARQVRDELRSFYQTRGFAVAGGAYSQHLHTVNAFPHILNFGRQLGKEVSKSGVKVGESQYLRALADKGYDLTVIQSEFADLCSGNPVRSCTTYESWSLRPALEAPLTTSDRARLIAAKFLVVSDLTLKGTKYWNWLAKNAEPGEWAPSPIQLRHAGRSSTVGALVTFDGLAQRLISARPGEAYIAHLLAPHYPYVVRGDCSYLPADQWIGRKSKVPLGQRRRAYFEQVRCVTRKIDAALSALARSPAGANSVVIIHGDHGSRLSESDPGERNLGKFGGRDLIAGFSTLFAVRAPGIKPAYSRDRARVAELLRDFTAKDFRSVPLDSSPQPDRVYLDNRRWKPTRQVALPADWPNP
jgi:hypothetical protein